MHLTNLIILCAFGMTVFATMPALVTQSQQRTFTVTLSHGNFSRVSTKTFFPSPETASRLATLSFLVSKRADAVYDGKHVEASLRQFMKWLKDYTIGTGFSFQEFNEDTEVLASRLDEIEKQAMLSAPTEDLLAQVKYVRQMYQTMVDSLKVFDKYDSKKSEIYHSLTSIHMLNVGLLRLRNTHGEPDLAMSNYEGLVTTFHNCLKNTERDFRMHVREKAPWALRAIYEQQVMKAEDTLAELSAVTPIPGRP